MYAGFDGRSILSTPSTPLIPSTPEKSIQRVMRIRSPENHWFAIDDDHFGWLPWYRNSLIQTNGSCGISAPDIQVAVRVMLERF